MWLAVRLGLGALPPRVNWAQLYGAALLAGVGFTMSLFITTLAFANPALLGVAKLAILIGSTHSAIAGLVWLSVTGNTKDWLAAGEGPAASTVE